MPLPYLAISCETYRRRVLMKYKFAPFLVLAIAFIALGATGQRVFIYLGIAFLVIALVMLQKRRSL
jgi:LPXTG-motif cell wall-anchored protein